MANHKEEVLFYTRCKVQRKVCSLKIDTSAKTNVASEYMVKKLGLTVKKHLWIGDSNKLRVNRQVTVSISIGRYKDEVLCDVQPMETCHILLGKPWQSKHQAIQDYSGAKNRYSFNYKGLKLFLVSMTPQEIQQDQLVLKQKHTEASSASLTRTDLIESSIPGSEVPDSTSPSRSSLIDSSTSTSAEPPLEVPTRLTWSSQAPFFQFGSFQLLEFKIVEEVDFVFGNFAFSKPENKIKSLLDEVMKPKEEEQLVCFRPNKTKSVSPFQEKKHSNFKLIMGKEFGSKTETDYLKESGVSAASKVGNIFLYLRDMNHQFNPGIHRDGYDLRTNPFQLGEDDVILSSITQVIQFITEWKPILAQEELLDKDEQIIKARKTWISPTTTFDPGIAQKNNNWAFDLKQVIHIYVQPNCCDQDHAPFNQSPRPIIPQFRGLI